MTNIDPILLNLDVRALVGEKAQAQLLSLTPENLQVLRQRIDRERETLRIAIDLIRVLGSSLRDRAVARFSRHQDGSARAIRHEARRLVKIGNKLEKRRGALRTLAGMAHAIQHKDGLDGK